MMTKSHAMAVISGIAYKGEKTAAKAFKDIGYPNHKYISKKGAQCHVVWNSKEVVVAFRGTEPKQTSDIKADLNIVQQQSNSEGDVHGGFKTEIDKVWVTLVNILKKRDSKLPVFVTGHSLGGAMATICCSRLEDEYNELCCFLYTYGSPRVGDKEFVEGLCVPHMRFQNNNDVVCKIPFWVMGYRHHGTNQYINYYGNIRKMGFWQRLKDSWRSRIRALLKGQPFDGVYDHSIDEYIRKLKNVVLDNN